MSVSQRNTGKRMPAALVIAAAALGLMAAAGSAQAINLCTAADLFANETVANCPPNPSVATCTIAKDYDLGGANCTVDLSGRDVVIPNGTIIDVGSNKITFISKNFTISGSGYLDARGNTSVNATANAGSVTIQSSGNVSLAASNSRIEAMGEAKGGKIIISATGSVSIAGQLEVEQLLTAATTGSIEITAGTTVSFLAGSTIDATGAVDTSVMPIPPKLKITAGGAVTLSPSTIDLDGGGVTGEALLLSSANLTINATTIDIGASSAAITCNNLIMAANSYIDARGTVAAPSNIGGMVTVNATGSVNLQAATSRIDAGGSTQGGRITITAAGLITIGGRLNVDALGSEADAGVITVTSTTGAISAPIGSDISGKGGSGSPGGDLNFSAKGDITFSTPIVADGGDGGNTEIVAGGAVTMAAYSANGSGTGLVQDSGAAGILCVEAGTSITLNGAISANGVHDGCGGCISFEANFGDILVTQNISAESTQSFEGGPGGQITLTTPASLIVQAGTTLSAYGDGLDGCGGSICLEGSLGVSVAGVVRVSGGSGGFIDIVSDGNVSLTNLLDLKANSYGGGELSVVAGLDGTGNLTVAGMVDITGAPCSVEAGCGTGGGATMEGCSINLTGTSFIDGRAPDGTGSVMLTAHEQLTIAGNINVLETQDGLNGTVLLDYRTGIVPSITGAIQPAPMSDIRATCTGPDIPANCLAACPTCGNSIVEFPEHCDNGGSPPLNCDGCTRFCRIENCDDNNVCTTESCDPSLGCKHVSNPPCATATPSHTPTGGTRTPTITRTPLPPTRTRTGTQTYTPTITRTPTISATPTISGTPTITRTFTLSPTITPTPTATPVALTVAKVAGRPNGKICLAARLTNAGSPLTTSNDLGDFSGLPFTFQSVAINPTIGPTTVTDKQVVRTPMGTVDNYAVSGTNMVGIPNGDLYTATYTVSGTAVVGTYNLTLPAPGSQVVVSTCTGDCNGNNQVSIGEVQQAVNKFLGAPICNPAASATNCPMADANNNNVVSIGEVQQTVTRFLGSCGT